MNVVLISQRAPLYLPYFLDKLCAALDRDSIKLTRLVFMSPYTKENLFLELKKRIQFYGALSFIKLSIQILKNKIKAHFFKGKGECYSIDNVLKKYGIPELKTKNVNQADFIQELKNLNTDVILSVACPQIFKAELIQSAKKTCINYHTAFLPKYRGRQPLFWALYHDENKSGVTVHEMDVKIDNGDIFIQKEYPIKNDDTLHDLYGRSMDIGVDCIVETLKNLAENKEKRIKNDASQSSYYSFPSAEDAKKFRTMGKRFI